MDYKFIQPVSMQVTREQYERDLREPLLAMGYKEKLYLCWMVNSCDYLVTNFNKEDNKIGCLSKSSIHRLNRYFIPEYNPKLLLAIAAMTDSISPIVGEWIVYTDSMAEMCGLTAGELYRIGKLNTNTRYMRKATLQELINKFTNQKQDIMKKELTQELIKDLKNLIAPENEEAFNKIMGIKKPIFNKENFITGDKVIVRNGSIYLVIKDCNAGCYGKQVFTLLRCNMNGGFLSGHFYNNELRNPNLSDFDIMKVYRFEDGRIVYSSMNGDLEDYDLVWSRE